MSYTRKTTWSVSGSPQGSEVHLIKGGSLYSTSSVHGGAGGSHISVSARPQATSGWKSGGSYISAGGSMEGLLTNNEKETMQNLNNRLSSYLEQVHALEEDNADLERKIGDWYAKHAPSGKWDYSAYEKTIADLHAQIATGRLNNARMTLQMDNAKLAVDDFTTKYNKEKDVRLTLEADVDGIRKLLDNMTIVKTDLEMEVEGLRKQLICMRKKHEEDTSALRSQQSASDISVDLKASPSADLAKILKEVREEYEAIIAQHQQEADTRYKEQAATISQNVSINTDTLQSGQKEMMELKRVYQDLQIELQTEQSRKYGLERTLQETQCSFGEQLQNKQRAICQVEAELVNVRRELERQDNEHQILMGIKTRLEHEIATYRQLLERDDFSKTAVSQTNHRDTKTSRKVKTIVQDVVDGRVISSKVSEIHRLA